MATRLYGFLSGQKAIAGLFSALPLVRLDDGTHVIARENAKSNAFLPSDIETSFPTVRRAVCRAPEARSFLASLGLTAPDPVDDVVWNVLPKYRASEVDGDDKAYAIDIERIRVAFNTDSKAQRDKLLAALRETPFLMVIDTGDGKDYVSKPGEVYIATDRLKALFAGVPGVFVVDDNYECLRGEAVRELLEACGALRYPRPVQISNALTWEERRELRSRTGHEETSGQNDVVIDWELLGFEALLDLLPSLSQEQRAERARLLWEALGDLEERRGRGVFDGSYTWTHYGQRKAPPFPAAFLRRLAKSAWVPDASGDLVRPALATFESLGWKPNPFLLSKIAFKPPIIDQLAKEAGIEPAALDLLRKLGITSVADLARIGIANKPAASPPDEAATDDDDAADDGAETEAAEADKQARDDAGEAENVGEAEDALNADKATPSEDNDAPDLSVAGANEPTTNDTEGESAAAEPAEPRANGARGTRSTSGEHHPEGAARPGQRNITGQAGLDEQAKRLGRRVASFFDGAAPDADVEEAAADSSVAWQTKLVCLDVAAGGLQLEIGPLDGLGVDPIVT